MHQAYSLHTFEGFGPLVCADLVLVVDLVGEELVVRQVLLVQLPAVLVLQRLVGPRPLGIQR